MQLKHIMPVVILVCAAADATVRVLPFEIATPSAFLAASRWLRPDKTLTPNRSFHVNEYGELARLGNLKQFVHYRPVTLTTDSMGYRNPPGLAGKEIHLLVAGDSLALGMSVNDHETLSATGDRQGFWYDGGLMPELPIRVSPRMRKWDATGMEVCSWATRVH